MINQLRLQTIHLLHTNYQNQESFNIGDIQQVSAYYQNIVDTQESKLLLESLNIHNEMALMLILIDYNAMLSQEAMSTQDEDLSESAFLDKWFGETTYPDTLTTEQCKKHYAENGLLQASYDLLKEGHLLIRNAGIDDTKRINTAFQIENFKVVNEYRLYPPTHSNDMNYHIVDMLHGIDYLIDIEDVADFKTEQKIIKASYDPESFTDWNVVKNFSDWPAIFEAAWLARGSNLREIMPSAYYSPMFNLTDRLYPIKIKRERD